MTLKTNCWCLDYEPSFDNLMIPDDHSKYIKSFIKGGTSIPMNLLLTGNNGCCKTMYVKCILNKLYTIKMNDFCSHNELPNTSYYKSIYIFDFLYYNSTDTKTVFEFIKKYAKRILINTSIFSYNITENGNSNPDSCLDSNPEKMIIIKNAQNINNKNILILKNIIEKNLDYCKFIILTSHELKYNFNSLCCPITLKKLNEPELTCFFKKIFKTHKINIKNTQLTYKKIWKIYQDINYNLRDIILWVQYSIIQNDKGTLPIKIKLISGMLNYVFLETDDNIAQFKKIKELLVYLISMGISHVDIVKYSLIMIINNKNIESDKKKEVISMCSKTSIELSKQDRKIFSLEHLFINIAILFK
jgi:hypothetical protein